MDEEVEYSFKYLRVLNIYFRRNVILLFILIPLYIYWFETRIFDREDLVANFSFIGMCSFLGFMFFLPFWSNVAMSYLHYSSGTSIKDSTHILVKSYFRKRQVTSTEIVPILYVENFDTSFNNVYFIRLPFSNRLIYSYDKSDGLSTFRMLQYPENEKFGFYLQQKGFMKTKEVEIAESKYGNNDLEIPMPQFFEIFKEHMVAPFFVFQIFCTFLWMLDEYWYYSLFTFSLLLFAESTVVFQRKKNMERLRAMRIHPYDLYVLRQGEWKMMSSEALLPGDICLLNTNKKKEDKKEEKKRR